MGTSHSYFSSLILPSIRFFFSLQVVIPLAMKSFLVFPYFFFLMRINEVRLLVVVFLDCKCLEDALRQRDEVWTSLMLIGLCKMAS